MFVKFLVCVQSNKKNHLLHTILPTHKILPKITQLFTMCLCYLQYIKLRCSLQYAHNAYLQESLALGYRATHKIGKEYK